VPPALIPKIYAVEREPASWDRDERLRVERERRPRPLHEKLERWLKKNESQAPPRTALDKAVTYALAQWHKMSHYLERELLIPDTNRGENAIRPFVLGRNNRLFSGSPRGANASMTLYSLIVTAKANGVEPYRYLRALFEQLPTLDPNGDHDELLPWNTTLRKPEGYCSGLKVPRMFCRIER
jgi:transposase